MHHWEEPQCVEPRFTAFTAPECASLHLTSGCPSGAFQSLLKLVSEHMICQQMARQGLRLHRDSAELHDAFCRLVAKASARPLLTPKMPARRLSSYSTPHGAPAARFRTQATADRLRSDTSFLSLAGGRVHVFNVCACWAQAFVRA